LVIKNPLCTVSENALTNVEAAHRLFEYAATQGSVRANRVLPIVERLRNDAREKYLKHNPTRVPGGCSVGGGPEDKTALMEELDLVFGFRRIREIPGSTPSESSGRMSTSSLAESVVHGLGLEPTGARPTGLTLPSSILDSVHPDLMADLQSTSRRNAERFPNEDWSLSGIEGWNDGQQEAPFAVNFDALMASVDPTQGVLPNASGGQDTVPGAFDIAGGVVMEPSWQTFMGDLGFMQTYSPQ